MAEIWWQVGNPPRAMSEFPPNPQTGHALYTDACGPNAYEVARAALANRAPSQANMTAIRNAMIARGWFHPKPGPAEAWYGTLISYLYDYATQVDGFADVALYPNGRVYSADDLASLCESRRSCPIILNIGKALMLPFNEPNVWEHYVSVLAYDNGGGNLPVAERKVLIANGDRVPAGGPDWMTLAQVAAAQIIGMVSIRGNANGNGGTQVAWTRNTDGTADDAQKHHVGAGIAQAIFAHGWQGADGLTNEEAYANADTFVALSNGGVINWDGAAHIDQAGQVLAAVWQQGQTAQSQLANANNQLTGANATIAQLQAEIAALKAQQPPAPPASDPLAAKALATLQDLAATLKEM